LSLNKQGRPEHIGSASVPRLRLITGATEFTKQQQTAPEQPVQIHHLQVPRIIQKTVASTPAQVTHLLASTQVVVSSTQQPTTRITEPPPVVETTTKAAVSHLSPNKKA
jgi:hypothetical protein